MSGRLKDDSIRIIDDHEPDVKRSLAFLLHEVAYNPDGSWSDYLVKVMERERAAGKNPLIITDWRNKLAY